METCIRINCWYNHNGECRCCDDLRDNTEGKDCLSFIDQDSE